MAPFIKALGLALVLGACTQSLDVEDKLFVCASDEECLDGHLCLNPIDDPSTTVCRAVSVLPPAAECRECMATSCKAELVACLGDATCTAEHTCLAACQPDDAACKTRCHYENIVGDGAALDAFGVCMSSSCASLCGQTCGDIPVLSPPEAEPGCRTCIESNCCDAATACATDPFCREILSCLRAPTNGDQDEYCVGKHTEEERARYIDFQSCFRGPCNDACEADYSCVGHVSASLPETSDPLQWTFVISGLKTGINPVPGAEVKLCEEFDILCENPIDTQISDDEGRVHFNLPVELGSGGPDRPPLGGWSGNLAVTHPSDEWLPARYQPTPPITAPSETRTIATVHNSVTSLTNILIQGEGSQPIDLEEKGALSGVANDCVDEVAKGAYLIAESIANPNAEFVYVYNRNSTPTTRVDSVGPEGLFLIANIPEGLTRVRMFDASDRLIAETTVFVRSGWLTNIVLHPTPLE